MLLKRLLCLVLAMMLFTAAAIAEMGDDIFLDDVAPAVRIVNSDEPTHLNVGNTTKVSGSFFSTQFGNNTSDIDVRYMLHGYNPIIWADQIDFVEDASVVKQLTVSEGANGTVYTIELCDDLTWNDGTPITARDYVFSYLLLASDEIFAIGADTGAWKHVVGYDEYSIGESEAFRGINLIDEYTYSVTVKSEYLPYFYELSYLFNYPYPISVIAPGCVVEETAQGAVIANEDKTVVEPVFTAELLKETVLDAENGYLSHPWLSAGPYKLVSYDRESGVVDFELNEYYKGNWEGVKPVINTVTLMPCLPENMMDRLANGEIDLINKAVDKKVIDEGMVLMNEGGYTFENYPRMGYGYLALATEQGPQQFKKVRQALAYCFDSEAFVSELLGSYGIVDYSYYGLAQWMYQAVSGALRPDDMKEDIAAIWDAQNLDNLKHYDMDYSEALALLIEDGWTLNAEGKKFDPATDDFRYKRCMDGTLMKLSFRFAQSEGNEFAAKAVEMLETAFEVINAELIVDVVPFTAMLADYYRDEGERVYDMNFMATNYVSTFDPYMTYTPGPDFEGEMNTSGFYDEELFLLAKDMHDTEPHSMLEYLVKWVLFEERWNEVLPTVPIYTNVYFDFHTTALKDYFPNAQFNWPVALIYAYISDEEVEPIFADDMEDDDMLFID